MSTTAMTPTPTSTSTSTSTPSSTSTPTSAPTSTPARTSSSIWKRLHRLERVMRVERPRDEVFAFFADAGNLEAITPAFLRFCILTAQPIEMRPGARIDYALSLLGVPLRWRTRITEWTPGFRFVDEQESGPYALWRHTHSFEPDGGATIVRDVVEYVVPFGPVGEVAHVLLVRRALERIFDHRRDAIRLLLGAAGGTLP